MGLMDYLQPVDAGRGNRPLCEENIRNFNLIGEISQQGQPYFFGGATSLVLSSGMVYRCHGDFDVFLLPEDFGYWNEFFNARGYELVEDISRDGKPIFRGFLQGEYVFDAKFIPFDSTADDGGQYEVVTAQVGPYSINIVNPEYNKWQKVWMVARGEGRLKDRRDLEMYG